jgi:hypothetical protein
LNLVVDFISSTGTCQPDVGLRPGFVVPAWSETLRPKMCHPSSCFLLMFSFCASVCIWGYPPPWPPHLPWFLRTYVETVGWWVDLSLLSSRSVSPS